MQRNTSCYYETERKKKKKTQKEPQHTCICDAIDKDKPTCAQMFTDKRKKLFLLKSSITYLKVISSFTYLLQRYPQTHKSKYDSLRFLFSKIQINSFKYNHSVPLIRF